MAFRERADLVKSNQWMNDTVFCLVAVAMGGVVVTLFTGMQMPQGDGITADQLSSLVSQAASAGHHSGIVINR